MTGLVRGRGRVFHIGMNGGAVICCKGAEVRVFECWRISFFHRGQSRSSLNGVGGTTKVVPRDEPSVRSRLLTSDSSGLKMRELAGEICGEREAVHRHPAGANRTGNWRRSKRRAATGTGPPSPSRSLNSRYCEAYLSDVPCCRVDRGSMGRRCPPAW